MRKMGTKHMLYTGMLASLILTGCSSAGSSNTSASSTASASVSAGSMQSASNNAVNASDTAQSHTAATANTPKASSGTVSSLATQTTSPSQTRKMVIYNADLTIQVKNFSSAQSQIEQLASNVGGYVLDSTVSDHDQTTREGKLTLRIPNQQFESFLNEVAKVSTKVVSRTVTGEDVTEQYVDLASTLKAKQQVEDRLNSFMQNAKSTDDLLKISNNLAQVQQDIETIKGKMKYLEVNSDLSKVTINLSENPSVVATANTADKSVWGKTKSFFVNNLNWLISILSSLFIFLLGASPTLICLAIIGWVVYIIRKKRQVRLQHMENQDHDHPHGENENR